MKLFNIVHFQIEVVRAQQLQNFNKNAFTFFDVTIPAHESWNYFGRISVEKNFKMWTRSESQSNLQSPQEPTEEENKMRSDSLLYRRP